MILIVGLGNPGKKFEKTRHNVGFRVVDELRSSLHFATARVVDEFGRKNNFPKFKSSKKFQAEISEGKIADQKVILAKPKTFMNLSGKAVKSLITHYRQIKAMAVILRRFENLWIIHDDIDLPLGKIKISTGRSSAGHKGVQSIIDELGMKDFVRFRIGIGPQSSTLYAAVRNVEKFVLQKFNKGEEKIIKKVIKKTIEASELSLKRGLEKTMSEFNK